MNTLLLNKTPNILLINTINQKENVKKIPFPLKQSLFTSKSWRLLELYSRNVSQSSKTWNMSEHQKIHPVSDPEAPPPPTHPTVPLVSRGSSRSEHGDTTKESVTQPPQLDSPQRKKKGRRSCWCRCVCYTLLVLFLLIVVVGAAVGILYLVFRPKLPDYNIDRLQLTRSILNNQDSSLSTAFNVTITAKNPNEKIGIYYEDGSKIRVLYMQTRLSNGTSKMFEKLASYFTVFSPKETKLGWY